MAKRKVCKKCRYFFEGEVCPACKSSILATSWQGRVVILDEVKSQVAQKVGLSVKGEYAIKVR